VSGKKQSIGNAALRRFEQNNMIAAVTGKEDCVEIFIRHYRGESVKSLAKEYHLHPTTIYSIVQYRGRAPLTRVWFYSNRIK